MPSSAIFLYRARAQLTAPQGLLEARQQGVDPHSASPGHKGKTHTPRDAGKHKHSNKNNNTIRYLRRGATRQRKTGKKRATYKLQT